MASLRQCQVCSEAPPKYKCPSCYIPYCSLACFKKHKEIPCVKPAAPVESPSKITVPEESTRRVVSVEKPNDVLLQAQLESVAACSEIRDALTDENLQRLIRKIDSSEDPEAELDKAMEEGEVFRIFADKILSVVDR